MTPLSPWRPVSLLSHSGRPTADVLVPKTVVPTRVTWITYNSPAPTLPELFPLAGAQFPSVWALQAAPFGARSTVESGLEGRSMVPAIGSWSWSPRRRRGRAAHPRPPSGGAAAIHLDPGLVLLLTSVQSWRWFTDDTRTGTVRRHPMLSRAKSGVRPSPRRNLPQLGGGAVSGVEGSRPVTGSAGWICLPTDAGGAHSSR